MIKTILHVSDIQFRTFQRHDEFKSVCDNFIFSAKKHNADRIVITGDLVQSRNQLTPELVDITSWFIQECSKSCEKLIIIPGNHDIVEQNKSRMDAIYPIVKNLGLDNVLYIKHSEVVEDDNVLWVHYSIYDNHKTPDNMIKYEYTDKIKIGLFHGIINGATNNNGITFAYGASSDKFKSCDLVLCGDIHKRQVLETDNGVKLIMVGSLIQQNFGETLTGHGYCKINIDGKGYDYEFFDIFNTVKYLKFKINDIEDIENHMEILTNV